jgi:hypothetical protein
MAVGDSIYFTTTSPLTVEDMHRVHNMMRIVVVLYEFSMLLDY